MWQGITIDQLAINCNKSVHQIIQALSLIGITGDFVPETPIADLNILKETVKKMGLKTQLKPNIKQNEISKIDKEKELTKR